MKKLITMIVAATAIAFGARTAAATTISSVNFDSLDADADYNALYADSQDPEDTSAYYWVDGNGALFEASTVIGAVRAYAEASGGNTKYLELDTDGVVQRRAKADGTGTSMGNIFVDTLVQFTPSDEDAECSISATDKIAIWMQEKNIDSSDPELLPVTNLLVCAGAGDVGNAATNYVIAGTWEAGKWYRLVIKSGATAANGQPGFVIFIDGNKIADVNGVEVFPSLITSAGVNATTISHLGFNGTGAIDELVFTDEDPCPEVKFFTINWDSNVANIEATYTDGYLETQVTTNLSSGTTATLVLPPTGGSISIVTTLASGFGFDYNESNCSYANGTITVAGNAIEPTFTITPYSENFFVGNNSYEKFSEALAAAGASDGTIRLGKNVTIPRETSGLPGAIVVDSGSLVIDLAGNDLTGGYTGEDEGINGYVATIINLGCDLTITNSTVAVGRVIGADIGGDEYGDSLCLLDGDTTIWGGKFENQVSFDPEGAEQATLVINGGYFKANGSVGEDSFSLASKVDKTVYQIVDDNGYVVVSPIPNFTVTLPAAPANSTWTVTVGGNTISGVNNVYEVSDGDTLVATLTADEGYLFSDGTTSKVYAFEDIDSDINAAADPGFVLPTVTTPKAKIGTTIYLTLQDAINDAGAGDKVEVLASDTLAARIDIAAGKDITLDLGGYTLTAAGDAICNRGSIVITNGTITAAGNVAYNRGNGASITVEDGTYTSTSDIAFAVYGATNSTITVNGGTITAQEFCVGNYHPAKATTITINDGTLTSIDNAVVGTNGTAGDGDNAIYINGGTLNGGITTPGYVACGIYLPNDDTLVMTGGEINVTGGCGILARAGQVSVTGGEINTTGNVTGKVGDSRVVVPCSAIVFDTDANYPGYTQDAEFAVSGGTFSSEVDCVAQVNENGGDVAIAVSGGTFDQPLDPEYCAEGFVPADDGAGNYGVTYGYTITYVSAQGTAPAAKDVTVGSLGAAYTLVAADLPALEAAGYVFNGWGKVAGDTISADTTLTAQWATANYTITLPAAAANTTWYVEADGVEVVADAGVYTVAAGADVVVYSKADAGYLFENGSDTKTVYTFEDIAASQDKSADAAPAPAAAKAKIGTVLYLSLNDAVSAATNGATVVLLDNVNEAIVNTANKNFTIDLNGQTWSSDSDVLATSAGTITIEATNGGTMMTEAAQCCAVWAKGGNVVINGGTFVSKDNEEATIYVNNANSLVTINDGTFQNTDTRPYRWKTSLQALTLNVKNDLVGQHLVINGGTFYGNDPQLGDDTAGGSYAQSDVAFVSSGFVAIQDGSGNWVVQEGYNVTFDANGGTPAPDAQRVAAGGTATAPTAPTYEGYTFNGWKLNNAAYDFGTVLSGDITLVADWTAAPVAVVLNLEGSGTAVDPYLITNLADLQNFRDWVNDGNTGAGQYFKVTAATIDLASESPWTPIGSKVDKLYFSGEFDGNGVVINNLSLAASPDYPGFFSAVSNAVLKSFTLNAGSAITGLNNAAAVCALVVAGGSTTFSNVVNNVSISGAAKLGGFVCQANGEITFIDCVNNGAIDCTTLTNGKLAGGFIAMYNHGANVKASFLRCVNNGVIGTAGQSAGFVAYNQTCLATGGNEFTSCTNNGAITAQLAAGGFIGKGGSSNSMLGDYTFTDCAQLGTLTCSNSYNLEASISGGDGTHNVYGKTTVLSAYGLVNHNGIQAKKGWLWKAKIVGETYTTLYSDLATAVADADGETLVIAADSTLSNSFDIDGTVTIGSGIAVSGGNLRINSGTLAITGGTFTDVALAEAGTGEITITGGTFNADPTDFVADGYEAVEEGGLYTVQLAAPPAGKWDEVEANDISGMTSENKEAVEATLDKLETALGSVANVSDWISTVYGSADIPAAKLAATTDALIAISLAYDLPILEGEPEVEVATTTTTSGKAAFTFTFTDDGDPVSVQAEKALQLIKYSATVNGEFAYTPAKFVVTTVESANGNVLKAEFVGADAAGYGKVDFTVPQN